MYKNTKKILMTLSVTIDLVMYFIQFSFQQLNPQKRIPIPLIIHFQFSHKDQKFLKFFPTNIVSKLYGCFPIVLPQYLNLTFTFYMVFYTFFVLWHFSVFLPVPSSFLYN